MKKHLFVLLFTCKLLFSYTDQDLEELWSSITDIKNPTLIEYKLIENYFKTSRPYLDNLRQRALINPGYNPRLNLILNFKLLGPHNEMPLFEKHSFNIKQHSKNRCILLFASFNGIYQDKARKLLAQLEKRGYSGHVLLRIGGFPNTENGDLTLSHIPYAFKLAFLREAKSLGYKEVLWLDTAIHPLTNLETIFQEIKKTGYFFTSVGSLQDNAENHLPEAAVALNLNTNLYPQIPHISSGILGLNMASPKAHALLDTWYEETIKVYPNVSWFPEELSLSTVAFRLNMKPYNWFGHFVCSESELGELKNRPSVILYLDSKR